MKIYFGVLIVIYTFCLKFSNSQYLQWLEGANSHLTKEEEKTFCDLSKDGSITPLCDNEKGTDKNCSMISEKLGGSEASCSSKHVCSFKKGDNMVYVTNQRCIEKFIPIRACANNMTVLIPTKETTCDDAKDLEEFLRYSGVKNRGSYETPKVKPMILCADDGDYGQNMDNCHIRFRDEVLLHFHEEKRLGFLLGPHCMDLWDGPNKTEAKKIKRCQLQGFFNNEAEKKYDRFIINAFNQKNSKEVCTMTYWGANNIEIDPPSTPKP